MPMRDFSVDSRLGSYDVNFVNDAEYLLDYPEPRLFIIDKTVYDLYANTVFKTIKGEHRVLLEINEDKKSLETIQELYRIVIRQKAKKNLNLISIGGGITQDITGFLCSTIYRGINWGFVPTTLLAQADSCIGSKTSLNFDGFKNIVGSFYPPKNIKIYIPFLNTLSEDDFKSGLGEVAKLHITRGYQFADCLVSNLTAIEERREKYLAEAIYNSLMIKKGFIEKDEFDKGPRNLLNYGHCIGHALESVSGYFIPHGQAVAAGMILANLVSCSRGLLSKQTEEYLYKNLLIRILTCNLRELLCDTSAIFEAMKKDKKRVNSGIPIVMLKDNYALEKYDDLTEQELKYSVCEFLNRAKV